MWLSRGSEEEAARSWAMAEGMRLLLRRTVMEDGIAPGPPRGELRGEL